MLGRGRHKAAALRHHRAAEAAACTADQGEGQEDMALVQATQVAWADRKSVKPIS